MKINEIELSTGQISHIEEIERRTNDKIKTNKVFCKVYEVKDNVYIRKETALSLAGMDQAFQEVEDEDQETFSINNKAILKIGTWVDHFGQTVEITMEVLRNIKKAFKAGVASRDGVAMRVGAHFDESLKAAGYVQDVKIKGDELLADLTLIPKHIKESIERGEYRNVSSGLWKNHLDSVTNKTWDTVLNHLALLGSRIPAVSGLTGAGLDGWGQFFSKEDNSIIITFSESAKGLTQDKEETKQEEEEMDEKVKQQLDKLTNDLASVVESNKTISTKVADLESENTTLKAENDSFKQASDKQIIETKKMDIENFLSSDEMKRKILPASKADYTQILMNVKDEKEFSAKKEELRKREDVIEFKEQGSSIQLDGSKTSNKDVELYSENSNKFELEVRKYMKDNNLEDNNDNYILAGQAVSEQKPELLETTEGGSIIPD